MINIAENHARANVTSVRTVKTNKGICDDPLLQIPNDLMFFVGPLYKDIHVQRRRIVVTFKMFTLQCKTMKHLIMCMYM